MDATNPDPTVPITSVSTSDMAVTSNGSTLPGVDGSSLEGSNPTSAVGSGVDGEQTLWVGRYSMLNFTGGIVVRVVLTALLILSMIKASQEGGEYALTRLNWLFIWVVGGFWLYLGFRMVRAWFSRYYELTNRRLFVSSGILQRRRNMMELLRIKDVTMRQSGLLERWLGLGTVTVTSTEKGAPVFLLPGVNDPSKVVDVIWHHARSERDLHSVKVDQV